MEILNSKHTHDLPASANNCKKDFLETKCNWQILRNKQFIDAITVAPLHEKPDGIDLEEIVSLDTCIFVEQNNPDEGPCMLDIKITNGKRISFITVVSGAYMIEVFKQSGEYEATVIGSIIDKIDNEAVCVADREIGPASTEVSIKFTKRVNKKGGMWIYGIKLYLTEPIQGADDNNVAFNAEIIKSFFSKCAVFEKNDQKEIKKIKDDTNEAELPNANIASYIDNKLHDMEMRLVQKMENMEQQLNTKLDTVLEQLQNMNVPK